MITLERSRIREQIASLVANNKHLNNENILGIQEYIPSFIYNPRALCVEFALRYYLGETWRNDDDCKFFMDPRSFLTNLGYREADIIQDRSLLVYAADTYEEAFFHDGKENVAFRGAKPPFATHVGVWNASIEQAVSKFGQLGIFSHYLDSLPDVYGNTLRVFNKTQA